MEEKVKNCSNINSKKQDEKKFCLLRDDWCFGCHGQLSVLLKNVKLYFDLKPKNKEFADAILQVILCDIKHLIYLCNLSCYKSSFPNLLWYEKNTWQYYKDLKAPTKNKELYLDIALGEYLLIENYKSLLTSEENMKTEIKKLIIESQGCLSNLSEQLKKINIK